jgi:hypothetical protein
MAGRDVSSWRDDRPPNYSYLDVDPDENEKLGHYLLAEAQLLREQRAVELIAAGEEEHDGEKVIHVRDIEHGYQVAGVSPMRLAVGDFIASWTIS